MNVDTVAVRRARRRVKGVFVSPKAQVVRTSLHGEPIFFTVVNPRDEIQKYHLQGAFYEPEELAIIARHFPLGGAFLDIGTNIGNHTLYVAKFLRASRIVCIEPNPAAIAVLESNIMLNAIHRVVDGQYLGIGLSDHASETASMRVPVKNLGGSRVIEGAGDIRLARADTLLAGQTFDLVKIDVEGMELMVLAGMEGLLKTHRPKMFIEVDNTNAEGFDRWVKTVGYQVIERFQRYPSNVNYLVGPAT
ncbi:MAG: FkbM family methyltransferase [Paracoccaceae bacterium]